MKTRIPCHPSLSVLWFGRTSNTKDCADYTKSLTNTNGSRVSLSLLDSVIMFHEKRRRCSRGHFDSRGWWSPAAQSARVDYFPGPICQACLGLDSQSMRSQNKDSSCHSNRVLESGERFWACRIAHLHLSPAYQHQRTTTNKTRQRLPLLVHAV